MKILMIGDKEYKLEYSFAAATHKELINKVFKMLSGSYIGQQGLFGDKNETKKEIASAFIEGSATMFSETPETVIVAFQAGLMENNAVLNRKEATNLLKQYFVENADSPYASFPGMFNLIKECMEEDGFFKLTGMDEMLKAMWVEPEEPEMPKAKSTSGKKTASQKK